MADNTRETDKPISYVDALEELHDIADAATTNNWDDFFGNLYYFELKHAAGILNAEGAKIDGCLFRLTDAAMNAENEGLSLEDYVHALSAAIEVLSEPGNVRLTIEQLVEIAG